MSDDGFAWRRQGRRHSDGGGFGGTFAGSYNSSVGDAPMSKGGGHSGGTVQ